jgi:predicted hotdog family 3-hydroxylacyl-ACP dehydratase
MEIDLDEFLPHRDRMRLVDIVLAVDENSATTESIVNEAWPLYAIDAVRSLVIVELVAQTASICVGWKTKLHDPSSKGGRGWLVGIKNASFVRDKIPLNARIITRVKTDFSFENYTGIVGTAKIDSAMIGEVHLQVMQSETDSVIVRK